MTLTNLTAQHADIKNPLARSRTGTATMAPDGTLWIFGTESWTGPQYAYYSTDGGETWTQAATPIGGFSDPNGFYYPTSAFIDSSGVMHLLGIQQDRRVYVMGYPTANGTDWIWRTPSLVEAVQQYAYWKGDRAYIIAFPSTLTAGHSTVYIFVVKGDASITFTHIEVRATDGVIMATPRSEIGVASLSGTGGFANDYDVTWQHTGDGATPANAAPTVWIAAMGPYFDTYRLNYDPANPGALSTAQSPNYQPQGVGYHAAMATIAYDPTIGKPKACWLTGENNTGDLVGVIVNADMTYQQHDPPRDWPTFGTETWAYFPRLRMGYANGDTYLFFAAPGLTDKFYVSKSTGSGAWSPWEVFATLPETLDRWAAVVVRPQGVYDVHVLMSGQSGPTYHEAVTLNTPPNAPTLTTLTAGAVIDRASTNRASHTFADPDPGDAQSSFDHRYRLVGSSTWTEAHEATPNGYVDYPAGTFAAGDYERQVRTYDGQGAVGPWSASGFFTAANVPASPTITAPTNGATISQPSALVTWAATDQDAYQLQVLDDLGAVVLDLGTVTSTARSRTVGLPDNNVTRAIRVRVRANGLWSPWSAQVTVSVAFTPPPVPVLSLSADGTSIAVTVMNPAPVGDQPAVVENKVYITDRDQEELRARIAPNTTWTYYLPRSGIDYDGRVRVVAVADSGAETPNA